MAAALGAKLPALGQGMIERVSLGPGGVESNGYSEEPALSADGRFVAFISSAGNLVPGDTNYAQDVFVHDRGTRVTQRVKVGPNGRQANGDAHVPALSAGGSSLSHRRRATWSTATPTGRMCSSTTAGPASPSG
jgi:Tol biopolymer transport system component